MCRAALQSSSTVHVCTQGSAVTAAKLGDLKTATPQLLQLTRVKGQDPEVRLPLHLMTDKQYGDLALSLNPDWTSGTRAPAETLQVWRLLAETQMLQGDAAAAAALYQTADSRAGGGGIELLSAWTDALVAAGKPQKARFRFRCRSANRRQAPDVPSGH
jgi:hypothetical protein